jgi:hypothetical protein
MKSSILRKNPLVALLVALSLLLPAAVVLVPAHPVAATADNVTINTPTTAAKAYSRIGGEVMVNFNVGIKNFTPPPPQAIDIKIYLLLDGVTVGSPTTYGPTIVTDNAVYTWAYNLTIPAGTANGLYDVRVDARHPAGGVGPYTQSSVMPDCVEVNSTAVPSTPTGLLPACGSCSSTNTPRFSWTCVAGTGNKYDFQLATNTSFSSGLVDAPGLATCYYDPAALSNVTYYWHVRTVDKYGNVSSWTSTCSICIDTAFLSNPFAASPADGYTVPGNYNPTLCWTRSTDTCPCANVRYFVEIFSNVGLTTLADNTTGIVAPPTGNVCFTPGALLGGGTFWWRARAYDCAGNSSDNTSPRSFIISPGCTTYPISLSSGWNLVSLPLCPSGLRSKLVSEVLAGLSCTPATCVELVWGYDALTSSWQYYYPGGTSNTLTTWEVKKGYWIQMNQAATLTVNGSSCPAPPDSLITNTLYPERSPLEPGWNLIGFKSCSNLQGNTYLGTTCAANVSYMCAYAGGWNCGAPASITMEPGKGYWAYLSGTSNCSYGLPCQ